MRILRTSLANEGPERKTAGWSRSKAATIISDSSRPVLCSMPFDTHSKGVAGSSMSLMLLRNAVEDCTGTACTAY